MRVEIFNPQLSDFSEGQLRTIAESLIASRIELREKQRAYQSEETLTRMFSTEIVVLDGKLESMDEIIAQFMGALQIKEKENKIANN